MIRNIIRFLLSNRGQNHWLDFLFADLKKKKKKK